MELRLTIKCVGAGRGDNGIKLLKRRGDNVGRQPKIGQFNHECVHDGATSRSNIILVIVLDQYITGFNVAMDI